MNLLENRLTAKLEEISRNGLLRKLEHTSSSSLNFNTNDYLNLTRDPDVIKSAQEAIEKYGTSSSGSPAVNGYLKIHKYLEETLVTWIGFKECLLWTSGYSANYHLLKELPQKGDIILTDRYIHRSLIDGALASNAMIQRFQHNDINHLEYLIEKYSSSKRTLFVVMESLYSMDGDIPDLQAVAALKQKHNFFWILDEAHSIGWYGPKGNGLAEENGINQHIDILVGTLGKALASQGAFMLFNNDKIKEYLINTSKEFIYTTYINPASVGATIGAVSKIKEIIPEQPIWKSKVLTIKKALYENDSTTILNDSPIIPIILGDTETTLSTHNRLKNNGVNVAAIRPPSVPQNTSRLRLTISRESNAETVIKKVLPLIFQQ